MLLVYYLMTRTTAHALEMVHIEVIVSAEELLATLDPLYLYRNCSNKRLQENSLSPHLVVLLYKVWMIMAAAAAAATAVFLVRVMLMAIVPAIQPMEEWMSVVHP